MKYILFFIVVIILLKWSDDMRAVWGTDPDPEPPSIEWGP